MKPFSKFIKNSGSLKQIQDSARQLDELTRRIQAGLPADAASHVTGCALRPGTAIIFCDSPAWASQLRYSQQSMLEKCQQLFGDIHRIQFRILPPEPLAGKPPAPELTENSRRLLEQTAGGISDEELAQALRRLSLNADQDAD